MDTEGPGVVDRAVIVSRDKFTLGAIESLSREFLMRYGPARGLRRLIIATDEATLRFALFNGPPPRVEERGRKSYGGAFDELAAAYDRTVATVRSKGLPKGPVARLLAVNENALLTVRDGQSFIEKALEGSSDPTLVRAGGMSYRLLHIAVSGHGSATTLYFKASPELSVSSVASLTERFKEVVQRGQLSVEVRLDALFADNWDYPAILPFLKNPVVPDRFRYLYRGTLSCGVVANSRILCTGTSFHP